ALHRRGMALCVIPDDERVAQRVVQLRQLRVLDVAEWRRVESHLGSCRSERAVVETAARSCSGAGRDFQLCGTLVRVLDDQGQAMSALRAAGAACLAVILSAHVGSPDVFYSGRAGPYDVRVIVRPPEVVPGVARV